METPSEPSKTNESAPEGADGAATVINDWAVSGLSLELLHAGQMAAAERHVRFEVCDDSGVPATKTLMSTLQDLHDCAGTCLKQVGTNGEAPKPQYLVVYAASKSSDGHDTTVRGVRLRLWSKASGPRRQRSRNRCRIEVVAQFARFVVAVADLMTTTFPKQHDANAFTVRPLWLGLRDSACVTRRVLGCKL